MPLVRRTLFFLPEITSMTLIRPYLSLSPFQRFLPRLALDPIPSNRVPRGAANLFYSDPRNGRVSHGARATSFRNVLSGNRIDSRRRKKAKDLFVTSCRGIEITGVVCCPTLFILLVISIIESIEDL